MNGLAEGVSRRLLRNSVLWANVLAYHQPRVRVGPVVAQPAITVVARGHLPVFANIRRALERSVPAGKGILAQLATVEGDPEDELVKAMTGQERRWGQPSRLDSNRFLYYLVREMKPQTVLELGTAYGQGALHILAALVDNRHGHLTTVELDPKRRDAALANFRRFPEFERRVTSVGGDISDVAGRLAADLAPDLIFEDGPHDGTVTLDAFRATISHLRPGGVYVCDDVTADVAQEQAWVQMRRDASVAGSLEVNARHGILVRRDSEPDGGRGDARSVGDIAPPGEPPAA